jgi:II/X family phage/plasmid replication protein
VIDWLTFVAPLEHATGEGGPFWNGSILSTIPDPESGEAIQWQVDKKLAVEGSHSSTVTIKSTTDAAGRPAIYVSGNPAKWFQGHNVFGSDDLAGLCLEMLHRICRGRGVVPSSSDLAAWRAGQIELLRVDVTYSVELGNRSRVRAALRALDASAHLKHRGRGHFYGDAITWGKGSRRWSLTAYAKGPELDQHKLHPTLQLPALMACADGLLRLELRMQSMELHREGLHQVAAWSDNTGLELHAAKLSGLHIAEAAMLDANTLDGLSGRLQLAYNSWKEGHDLRAMLPRRTFYRYRAELLQHGIDIAIKQEREHAPANVVPLRLVLVAQPAKVPDWAVGTPLFFEPRALVA